MLQGLGDREAGEVGNGSIEACATGDVNVEAVRAYRDRPGGGDGGVGERYDHAREGPWRW